MQRDSLRPIQILALAVLLAPPAANAAESSASPLTQAAKPAILSIQLTVEEAIVMGLENNIFLQIDRFEPLIANEIYSGSWGAFDPLSEVEWGYTSIREPSNVNFLTAQGDQTRLYEERLDAGLSALVPYIGATVGIDFTAGKLKSFTTLTSQRPVWESGFTIRGSLPLLKGLIWNEPWTRVRTNALQYEGAREEFRRDLMNITQTIETLYWVLVAQRDGVVVAKKSLVTARSLLDQTRTQYEVGVKSRVEVVEAEAGVADREFDLIFATNRYRRSQDNLIDAVLGTRLTAGTRLEIDATEDPEDYILYEIDTAEAAEKAFANRPELRQAEYEIERLEVELKFAKNQRLPQLDLRASYGLSGERATGVFRPNVLVPAAPGIVGETTGNLGDTFGDFGDDRGGEDLTLGAVLSIPIGNIAARHGVSRSELDLRRARTGLLRLRQDIILEVRNAARDLTSGQEGIEAAERGRIAAAEQLRAERVRLEYGESTPFRVLEKESDLVEAENRKIVALRVYRTSVVDLNRAQGTILKVRNIVIEDAAALR